MKRSRLESPGRWFFMDSIPWDENHHEISPPFGRILFCHFFAATVFWSKAKCCGPVLFFRSKMVNETCFSSKRPGQLYPSAPIHSASGVGVGFRYLNTFSHGIWSTRTRATSAQNSRIAFTSSTCFYFSRCFWCFTIYLLGQWLNFQLFGITYLGKIKFKLLFQGPLAKWVHIYIYIPGPSKGCQMVPKGCQLTIP